MPSRAQKAEHNVLFDVLRLATISGLRSASGPAFLSHAVSRGRLPGLEGTRFALLGSPRVAAALKLALAGEMIGDKLPMAPSRTLAPALVVRALSGALVGASLFASSGRRAAAGGLFGASAAAVSAPAGENLRAAIVSRTGLPDLAIALLEDAIVLWLGSRPVGGER